MSDKQMQNEHYNDEIDLADLVLSLWRGKWLVIGVTFLTLLVAVAYLKLVPKTYTSSLQIAPLSSAQADVYRELNSTEFIAVDEQILLSLLIQDLQSYDGIEQFIKEYDYIAQTTDETDYEFAQRLRGSAYNFSITSVEANNIQHKWVVDIVTHDVELANKILHAALGLANANVNVELEKMLSRRIDQHVRKLKHELENIEHTRLNIVARYETVTKARIAELSEQAQIARTLGIDNGTLSSQTYNGLSALVTTGNVDQTLYLYGYLALEKEIQLLAERDSVALYIPSLASLDDQQRVLMQDPVVARAQEIFAITPIGTEQFEAAVYDMASMSYKSKTKTSLVLALSIVLGGMLGVFVLLIRNAVMVKTPKSKMHRPY